MKLIIFSFRPVKKQYKNTYYYVVSVDLRLVAVPNLNATGYRAVHYI